VLCSCPICGCGSLKPVLVHKILHIFEGNEHRSIGGLRAYSCASNGHILIIMAEGNGVSQTPGTRPASAAPERKRILNSWKEIAEHMGRGVRTVQRWEQELALPIRRPRGKSRSSVVALASDLDEWLHRAPVRIGPNSKGNGAILNRSHASAPYEPTASTAAKFVLPDRQKARTAFDSQAD
jgi:hypothetical protein